MLWKSWWLLNTNFRQSMNFFSKNFGCGKCKPRKKWSTFYETLYSMHAQKIRLLEPHLFLLIANRRLSLWNEMFSALLVFIAFHWMSSEKKHWENVWEKQSNLSHRAPLELKIISSSKMIEERSNFFLLKKLAKLILLWLQFLQISLWHSCRHPNSVCKYWFHIKLVHPHQKISDNTFLILKFALQNVSIFVTILSMWLLSENLPLNKSPSYFVSVDIDTSLFISAEHDFFYPKQMLIVPSIFRLSLFFFQPVR